MSHTLYRRHNSAGGHPRRVIPAFDDQCGAIMLNVSLGGPTTEWAIDQALGRLAKGPCVRGMSTPYDSRGQTLTEDYTTVFATVAFEVKSFGAAESEAAQTQPAECEHHVVGFFEQALLCSPLVLTGR